MYTFIVAFSGSTDFSSTVQIPQSGSMFIQVNSFMKIASDNATPEIWTSLQFPSYLWPSQEESKTIVLQYQEGDTLVDHDALASYTTDGKIIIECNDPTIIGNYFVCNGFTIDFSLP